VLLLSVPLVFGYNPKLHDVPKRLSLVGLPLKLILFANLMALSDFMPHAAGESVAGMAMGIVVWARAMLSLLVFYSDLLVFSYMSSAVNPVVALSLVLLEIVRLCSKRLRLGLRLLANMATGKLLGHLVFGQLMALSVFFWLLELLAAGGLHLLALVVCASLSFELHCLLRGNDSWSSTLVVS